MNHAPVASTTCATCHATGKMFYGVTIVTLPATLHIPNPSNLDCKGCHSSTTSFKTHSMDHSGISSNCTSCHGGQFPDVRSKPKDHPQTTADCSQCHSTQTFDKRLLLKTPGTFAAARHGTNPAVPQTLANSTVRSGAPGSPSRARGAIHVGVMPGACTSCHNGKSAPARPARHVATLLSCDSCHRTTAWVPANYTHTGVAPGGCASCHNGTSATGKPGNHFVTMRSCDTCHRTTSWRPLLPYRHLSPLYPANHPSVSSCAVCHAGNSELVTWRYPNLKPGCAGCHGPHFRGGMPRNAATPPARTGPVPRGQ